MIHIIAYVLIREIIFEELNACERLLKYATDYNINDEIDKKYIESEIAYLKMILDLIPWYIHIYCDRYQHSPKISNKGKISENIQNGS